jgi:hypothetical protein
VSKYTLFALLIGWLVLVTYFANVLGSYELGSVQVTGGAGVIEVGEGDFLERIMSMLRTFWSLLTFDVNATGFPTLPSILFFHLPLYVFVFMIIDIIKDLIPFT